MEKKDNILIVHNCYKIPGGEDSVVNNEINMLKKRSNVYTYFRHNNEINSMNLLKKILLPFTTIFSIKSMRDVKKIIKNNDIKIMHVHNTFPLISPSIYWVAKKNNVRVIQTIHNYRLVCANAKLYRNNKICEKCIKYGAKYGLKNKCYRNSYLQTFNLIISNMINLKIKSFEKVDRYICLTKFSKMKMKYLLGDKKIFIKENFDDLGDISIPVSSKKEFYIYIGRLDKEKGVDLLVKSWKNIKDEKLVIIGTGELENYIKEYIATNKISNISLMGYLPKIKAMDFLNRSKALIFPSQSYETFGLVLIEALKRGIPVIANDIGSVSEIVVDEKCGLLGNMDSVKNTTKVIEKFFDYYNSNYYNNDYIFGCYKDKYTEEYNYKKLSSIYKFN